MTPTSQSLCGCLKNTKLLPGIQRQEWSLTRPQKQQTHTHIYTPNMDLANMTKTIFHKLNWQRLYNLFPELVPRRLFGGGWRDVWGSFDEADRQHIRGGLPCVGKLLRRCFLPQKSDGRKREVFPSSHKLQRLITFVQDKLSEGEISCMNIVKD